MATTITIPGGQATLRDQDEMTERHRRPVKVISMRLMRVMGQLADITHLADLDPSAEDATERMMATIGMTEDESSALLRLTDAAIYAALKSWTLDLPIPVTVDEVQDIPGEVYDALAEATARTGKDLMVSEGQTAQAGFGPDSAGDVASPTGASGA